MTDISYPRAGANWTLPQWRNYHRADTGIVGSPAGTDRQVFVDGSGPYVKRLPGARFIQGIHGADDATWQATVPANTSGQLRIDRVVDELDEDGLITTVIVPGTASTSPSPPGLTQIVGGVWQDHLAYLPVPAGFANLTTGVVDERRFMPVRVVPVASEGLRPAAPRMGDVNVYPDGRRERWTGSAWVDESFANAVKFWNGADNSGFVLAANNNGTGGSSFVVTTPAGMADLTVMASVSGSGPWQASVGLRIDGVDRFVGMVVPAGPGAVLHGSIAVPLSAGSHTMLPRYATGTGSGLLTFGNASFKLVMGQPL